MTASPSSWSLDSREAMRLACGPDGGAADLARLALGVASLAEENPNGESEAQREKYRHAERACAALIRYAEVTAIEGEPVTAILESFLADLLHLLEGLDIDLAEVLGRAGEHFLEEAQ